MKLLKPSLFSLFVLPLFIQANVEDNSTVNTDPLIFRLDTGLNIYSLRHHEYINDPIPSFGDFEAAPVFGLAVEQAIDHDQTWGTKLEFQFIEYNMLTTIRALDYKFRLSDDWRIGGFIGAAHYDFRTPSFGYTAGVGVFYRPASWGNFGLGLEGQYVDKLARDKFHDDDPKGENVGPDSFIDIRGIALTLTYEF